MPNPYFKFKRFTVFHDRCAMKVGTDGVLLGSWVNLEKTHSAFDIGTGTGLIALMLAQRVPHCKIAGIEIEEGCAKQAKENINNSPFSEQVTIHHKDFRDFHPHEKVGLIVSNPPFFQNQLEAPEQNRNIARHQINFSWETFFGFCNTYLSPEGRVAFIIPFDNQAEIEAKAEHYHFFPNRITIVKGTTNAPPKRVLMELSREKKVIQPSELVIEKKRHVYTDGFKKLVKEFYLNL